MLQFSFPYLFIVFLYFINHQDIFNNQSNFIFFLKLLDFLLRHFIYEENPYNVSILLL